MPADEIELEAEERMEKAVSILKEELRGIRTGRATPGLVDSLRIEYYGTPTPLKNMANIACPDPRTIVVKPYDASQLGEIEKAILKANLGMTPNNDGKLIRLNVPELSQERRKQLSGQVRDLAEKARVAIRNVRRDANKTADNEHRDGILTEDLQFKLKEAIQELTKQFEKQVDEIFEAKSHEILEV
jgi:ribosome recycling factor